MKTDKEFDDFFRNRFQDFEGTPSENSWEKIVGNIPKKPSIFPSKGIVGMVLLAIITVISFFYVIPDFKKNILVENKEAAPDEISEDPYHINLRNFGINLQDTSGATIIHSEKDNYMTKPLADQVKEQPLKNTKIKADQNVSGGEGENNYADEKLVLQNNDAFKSPQKIPILNDNIIKSKTVVMPETGSSINLNEIEIADERNLTLTEEPLNSLANEGRIDLIDSVALQSVIAEQTIPEKNKESNAELSEIKEINELEENKTLEIRPANNLKYLVYFSPMYTLRRIIPNTDDEVFVEKVNNLNAFFGERLGYEAGLTVEKPVTSRWSVNVGFSFIAMNEKLNFHANEGIIDSVHLEFNQGNSYTLQNHYRVSELTYRSRFYYTGVNLGSSYYYWKSQRKALYFSFGGGVNLLIRGKTEILKDDETTSAVYFPSPENPLEQMNFRINFSPGYAYQISSRMQFIIEPTLNYYLGSTFKEREPIGIKPYTLGLNMGIKF